MREKHQLGGDRFLFHSSQQKLRETHYTSTANMAAKLFGRVGKGRKTHDYFQDLRQEAAELTLELLQAENFANMACKPECGYCKHLGVIMSHCLCICSLAFFLYALLKFAF